MLHDGEPTSKHTHTRTHTHTHTQKDEVYLNLVMEFIPETVYRVARHYNKNKQLMPFLYIKVG